MSRRQKGQFGISDYMLSGEMPARRTEEAYDDTAFIEPSLEEQLREQERAERQRTAPDYSDHLDEPGMDV